MPDLDMGEQFLNQPYCCLMSLRSSPYMCIKSTHLGEETVLSDPNNVHNPFHWVIVHLNLPGCESYNPQIPWVSWL
jgi:hypothetical protein